MKNNNIPYSVKHFGVMLLIFSFAGTIYAILDSSILITSYLIAQTLLLGIILTFAPWCFTPLHILWWKLGRLLAFVSNPVILAILFYLLLTPFAFIKRIFGQDELKLWSTNAESYWNNRIPSAPPLPNSFKSQF